MKDDIKNTTNELIQNILLENKKNLHQYSFNDGDYKTRNYNLYFLDEESFNQILNLEKELANKTDSSLQPKDYQNKILKDTIHIINRDLPIYSYRKELKISNKYSLITDKEKCISELEKKFFMYKAREERKLKKEIFKKNLKENDINIKKLELDKKVKEVKKYVDTILKDKEKYQLVISNYKRRLSYAHLSARYFDNTNDGDDKGKKKNKAFFLRENVSNIILFTPPEYKEYKNNIVLEKFIDTSLNILDDVYVKTA